jgi:hypothetical protein
LKLAARENELKEISNNNLWKYEHQDLSKKVNSLN